MNRRHLLKSAFALTLSTAAFSPSIMAKASLNEDNPPKDNHTLVLVSHPYPDRSVMIKGLQQAAESINGITVRNLEDLYGFDSRGVNVQTERRILEQHERIVFMYPMHWFNLTPMMKAYLNDVWGSVGPGLWQGKEMMVVTTAGGGSETYGHGARTQSTMEDILTPMKATAAHAGMTYLKPLYFLNVSHGQLPNYQKQLIERLSK